MIKTLTILQSINLQVRVTIKKVNIYIHIQRNQKLITERKELKKKRTIKSIIIKKRAREKR